MYQSLDKGNDRGDVVMAAFVSYGVCLTSRDKRIEKRHLMLFLSDKELKTLFKRAIKKGSIKKEDL